MGGGGGGGALTSLGWAAGGALTSPGWAAGGALTSPGWAAGGALTALGFKEAYSHKIKGQNGLKHDNTAPSHCSNWGLHKVNPPNKTQKQPKAVLNGLKTV